MLEEEEEEVVVVVMVADSEGSSGDREVRSRGVWTGMFRAAVLSGEVGREGVAVETLMEALGVENFARRLRREVGMVAMGMGIVIGMMTVAPAHRPSRIMEGGITARLAHSNSSSSEEARIMKTTNYRFPAARLRRFRTCRFWS